jgi:hypothetical protein
MIGSGIPINQSNAPFPNDLIVSILWSSNASGFHLFRWRLPRAARDHKPPRFPLTDKAAIELGWTPLLFIGSWGIRRRGTGDGFASRRSVWIWILPPTCVVFDGLRRSGKAGGDIPLSCFMIVMNNSPR